MSDHVQMSEDELRKRTRALLDEVHPEKTDSIPFRRKQFEHGLAWVHFPEGCGGLGLSPKMNVVVQDEIQKHSKVVHHDPPASLIGIGMGAPVVLTYGTEDMKKTLLPRIFSGEDIWCQLFSEPGAGSDVAGLATRQPWPSLPSMRSCGIRTSVRKTSLNSASPVIWCSGRTSTPGPCMSRMK